MTSPHPFDGLTPAPYLELFARQRRPGWDCRGTRTFGRRAALWSPRRRPAGAVQQVVSMESSPDTAGLVAVQPVLPIAPYVGGKRALAARLVAQIAPAST